MSSFSNNDVDILNSIDMNETRFLSLLEKLIGESVNLQNNPAQGNTIILSQCLYQYNH